MYLNSNMKDFLDLEEDSGFLLSGVQGEGGTSMDPEIMQSYDNNNKSLQNLMLSFDNNQGGSQSLSSSQKSAAASFYRRYKKVSQNQREGDAPDKENQRPQVPTPNVGQGRSLTRDQLEVGSPVKLSSSDKGSQNPFLR